MKKMNQLYFSGSSGFHNPPLNRRLPSMP
jgi:hypothetical protein